MASNEKITATRVVEHILKRGIEWFDNEDLTFEQRVDYYNEAQRILDSQVFQNEIKYAVSDIVKFIASKDCPFEDIQGLRMTINGFELLKERLESIKKPKQESEESTEPFSSL